MKKKTIGPLTGIDLKQTVHQLGASIILILLMCFPERTVDLKIPDVVENVLFVAVIVFTTIFYTHTEYWEEGRKCFV